jgi:hypothetical protein
MDIYDRKNIGDGGTMGEKFPGDITVELPIVMRWGNGYQMMNTIPT